VLDASTAAARDGRAKAPAIGRAELLNMDLRVRVLVEWVRSGIGRRLHLCCGSQRGSHCIASRLNRPVEAILLYQQKASPSTAAGVTVKNVEIRRSARGF